MSRYFDWPERLITFLTERDATPLKWGKSDCTLFAADAVEAMNGSDPAHFFRGKYKNKKEAFVLLRRFSGGGLEETTEKIGNDMGYSEIPPEFANSGDLALIDCDNVDPEAKGLTMAILANPTTAIAQGKNGLVYVHDADIRRTWNI
jgi:hypothetical protein